MTDPAHAKIAGLLIGWGFGMLVTAAGGLSAWQRGASIRFAVGLMVVTFSIFAYFMTAF
jgi:hypothetical protein